MTDVPAVPLPGEPSLEQLRNQAKDLKDASGAPLWQAQLTVARRYGFTGWARLKRHVEVITRYSRSPDRVTAADAADRFLRLACPNYSHDDEPAQRDGARHLLDREPGIVESNVYVAAATANVGELRRVLATDPAAARREGRPFRWEPLLYLAYARHDPRIRISATRVSARPRWAGRATSAGRHSSTCSNRSRRNRVRRGPAREPANAAHSPAILLESYLDRTVTNPDYTDIIFTSGLSHAVESNGRAQLMSTEATPGGPDGEEPFCVPVLADGLCGEDEEAWLRRMMAEADADEAWIPEEQAAAALSVLAGRPAGGDLDGLAQDGPADVMAPGPELAALAAGACDPAVLAGLTDDQVLGLAGAGRRLAGRGAWIQQTAVAEFAARRLEPDHKKATPLGFTPFAPDELVPELVIATGAAELAMAQARDAARRLPANFALLRDGRISAFQLKIITEATQCLSDADAAEADKLLAAAAPHLTPGQLRAMCVKTVLLIDPAAAQERKKTAAKDARITRFQEYSGNGALCGRELPAGEVLAASQHIDACARALRAAGAPGTLQQLRVRAYLDLTRGLDPLARLDGAAADGGTPQSRQDERAGDGSGRPDGATAAGNADRCNDNPDDTDGRDDRADGEDYGNDGGSGGDSRGGPRPGSPSRPSGGDGARGRPPVKAVITLLVPAGTLLGWSPAPGEIAGFGLLDPQTTREMTQAASAHPETRWCVTVVGSDGTAGAHGCAPGAHPWKPGGARDGPGSAAPAGQAVQIAELLRRLRVQLAPIAKGDCDHRHYSDRYVISRKVKHLITARTVKCTAPGCSRPAAESDADHTIPWPDGPSCECNLGPPCRYHHRNKQAPGWKLEQPEPGVMRWTGPSGRVHTTYPTKYII